MPLPGTMPLRCGFRASMRPRCGIRRTWTSCFAARILNPHGGPWEPPGSCTGTTAGLDVFLDGPDAKARDAVHIVFANEKVRAGEPLANPDVTESEPAERFRVIALEALVRIKLTGFRAKDRVHLRDLIEVGLVDAAWPAKLPSELAARLQSLLDTPGG
jgi:hypothetical protein